MFRPAPKKAVLFLLLNILFFSSALFAGNLDPSGPPGPTMRSLDEVGSWSQTLPGHLRFKVVLNGQAAFDKETGLVWELAPGISPKQWNYAQNNCFGLKKGGRMGWRLPTLSEMTSLLADEGSGMKLPAGHPFQLQPGMDHFWTETTATNIFDIQTIEWAWELNVTNGNTQSDKKSDENQNYVWCVRGGQGYDHP